MAVCVLEMVHQQTQCIVSGGMRTPLKGGCQVYGSYTSGLMGMAMPLLAADMHTHGFTGITPALPVDRWVPGLQRSVHLQRFPPRRAFFRNNGWRGCELQGFPVVSTWRASILGYL